MVVTQSYVLSTNIRAISATALYVTLFLLIVLSYVHAWRWVRNEARVRAVTEVKGTGRKYPGRWTVLLSLACLIVLDAVVRGAWVIYMSPIRIIQSAAIPLLFVGFLNAYFEAWSAWLERYRIRGRLRRFLMSVTVTAIGIGLSWPLILVVGTYGSPDGSIIWRYVPVLFALSGLVSGLYFMLAFRLAERKIRRKGPDHPSLVLKPRPFLSLLTGISIAIVVVSGAFLFSSQNQEAIVRVGETVVKKLTPAEMIEVGIGTEVRSRIENGTRYGIAGEDITFGLGAGGYIIISPGSEDSFNAKAITVIGDDAAYVLQVDETTCEDGHRMSGDVGFSFTKACNIVIVARGIESTDIPPTNPEGFEARLTKGSKPELIVRDGKEFVYVHIADYNHRLSILTNYGSWHSNIEPCVVGQTLGTIEIGPQRMTIVCKGEGRFLRMTYVDIAKATPSAYRFVDFEMSDSRYGWGDGRARDTAIVPLNGCPDLNQVSSRGQERSAACLEQMSESLAECARTNSSQCYFNVAVQTWDIGLCEKVTPLVPTLQHGIRRNGSNDPDRQSCYYQVATQKQDPGLCLVIDPDMGVSFAVLSARYDCVTNIARDTKDAAACDLVPEGDRAYCVELAGGKPAKRPKASTGLRTLTYSLEQSKNYPQAYAFTIDSDDRLVPDGARLLIVSSLAYTGDCDTYKGSHDQAEVWFDTPLTSPGSGFPHMTLIEKSRLRSGAVRCAQIWKNRDFKQALSRPLKIVLP